MKYSINSAGRIVAERDIYSLGGFIPKGRLGGFIADETQLSQEGECWLDSGDISTRPDVRIKDNAFIGGFFRGENPVHTDIVTEFSGNTLIPGSVSIRCFAADTKNNMFVKDSFIGVSMDVLCGPESTTTAFPFGQGVYNNDAAKGTLFENMVVTPVPVNICRSLSDLRLGKDTYLYIPTGCNCRVLWAYYDTSDRLAYSGESTAFSAGLHKLSHPVYKVARMHIAKINGTAMTPTDLLATGAKILGHISGSVLTDIRPESVSGDYVMVNSSFIAETDNFGLNTTQLRFLAGSMYDTTMYTKTDRSDYKPYGTFRNVERLEYTKYLPNLHRTAATRDTYISAYDCPLLRVDDDTYDTSLMGTGDLVLRRCIVPKGRFAADPINGNTYEDLDFSYANEDLGLSLPGYAVFTSSHRKGMYRVKAGIDVTRGLVSYKGNLADSARLTQAGVYLPLDGDIIEQGAYAAGINLGANYETTKVNSNAIVRTYKPVLTEGLILPSMPTGFVLDAIIYLDETFIIRKAIANPSVVETTYKFAVMQFRRSDTTALTASGFIALNRKLEIIGYTKVPEITGSAYVGAGCTVRGDVKLIGDPYVNRLLDVNMWERGENTMVPQQTWEAGKNLTNQERHFEFKEALPVETGGTLSAASGYFLYAGWMDENKRIIFTSSMWAASFTVPANAKYVGLVLKKAARAAATGSFIEDSDIPLANVKYVRAFKKRRYIVNELDRTSPEDILLSVDYWEQGTAGGGQADAGKTYEEIKATSGTTIRLKRPINVSPTSSRTSVSGFLRHIRVLDAGAKFRLGELMNSAEMALLAAIIQKDPSAAITPSEIPTSRLVLEFVPQPRIIVPYGSSTLLISGPKIRMYDNAVLSRNLNQEGGEIVLQGDAVMGYDFNSGSCMCSNGHSDAIIKLP